jgi:predicted dinucleotide-binding enzyme
MEVSKKIALIGLGAIGCALVKQAKDEGTNISVICNEERKKRYSSNSFTINNQRYSFTL